MTNTYTITENNHSVTHETISAAEFLAAMEDSDPLAHRIDSRDTWIGCDGQRFCSTREACETVAEAHSGVLYTMLVDCADDYKDLGPKGTYVVRVWRQVAQ